jgi:hypothetical protein
MDDFRAELQNCYGSIAYKRHATKVPGVNPKGAEARKKRLTEEIDDWLHSDHSAMSVEEARMIALVDQAEKAFVQPNLSPQDAERLAKALDDALDDD